MQLYPAADSLPNLNRKEILQIRENFRQKLYPAFYQNYFVEETKGLFRCTVAQRMACAFGLMLSMTDDA